MLSDLRRFLGTVDDINQKTFVTLRVGNIMRLPHVDSLLGDRVAPHKKMISNEIN